MRNKIKVINIMAEPPAYKLFENEPRPECNWDTPSGLWIGIWGLDWHDLLGNEVLKITDEFDYEVWQLDLRADKIYSHRFENGLVHMLFPARKKYYLEGLKIKKGYFSKAMVLELDEVRKKRESVILHLDARFSWFSEYLVSKFHNELPMVHQFYGDYTKVFNRENTKHLIKRIHRKLKSRKIKKYFSKVQEILTCKNEGVDILNQNVNANIHKAGWGIDFHEWCRDKSKEEARDLLHIPKNKYVILASSRLYPVKQVDKLIGAISHVSNQNFRCYITGHGTEMYEKKLKELVKELNIQDKVIFVGFVDKSTLKNYYLASDLFISTSSSEGGPYSSELALALEVPIMTTDTGLVSEILKEKNAGVILPPNDYDRWREEIEKAVLGRKINVIPREEIIKLFNWNYVANDYKNIYLKTIQNFYG